MRPTSSLMRPTPQLALIAVVLILTMATWFAASASAPALRHEWGLNSWQGALLTSSVQLGFVVGAVASAVLNLPDVLDAGRLMAGAAVVAALTTAAMAVLAHELWVGAFLRLLTGVALAGVYPVAMKLASSWFLRGRGLALAILIGALTLGSALPEIIDVGGADTWRAGLCASAMLALIGAAITFAFVRIGPLASRAPRFEPGYVLTLARTRAPRLVILGYVGHMWELYAAWVWLPTFFAASLIAHGSQWPAGAIAAVCFVTIGVCGALGCLVGGWWGDRIGRARVAALAMTVSGACCMAAALLFGRTPALLVLVMVVWGASVIADSAMFSACLASVVDTRFIGTALTLQTAIGFLVTIVTIQGVPLVVDYAGWPVAIAILGIGPLLGALAMRRLGAAESVTGTNPATAS